MKLQEWKGIKYEQDVIWCVFVVRTCWTMKIDTSLCVCVHVCVTEIGLLPVDSHATVRRQDLLLKCEVVLTKAEASSCVFAGKRVRRPRFNDDDGGCRPAVGDTLVRSDDCRLADKHLRHLVLRDPAAVRRLRGAGERRLWVAAEARSASAHVRREHGSHEVGFWRLITSESRQATLTTAVKRCLNTPAPQRSVDVCI